MVHDGNLNNEALDVHLMLYLIVSQPHRLNEGCNINTLSPCWQLLVQVVNILLDLMSMISVYLIPNSFPHFRR